MNLFELGVIVEAALDVEHFAKDEDYPSGRWTVQLRRCEVKNGATLSSLHGFGHRLPEAMWDYARQLAGQRIVFNPYNSATRREYTVPKTLDGTIPKVKP